MAMNGDDLGDTIDTYMKTAVSNISDPSNMTETDVKNLKRAMGNAIVDYIKANMQVTITTPGFVETFVTGVGSNGGSLVDTAGIPINGTIKTGAFTTSEGKAI